MSLRALWSFLAIALPVLASLLAPMSTVDLTYQLRAGAEILSSGMIPAADTWTFTINGLPWFDQQWGAQVVLSLAATLGGWTGLVLVRAALTAVIVGCLFLVAVRRGLDTRMAALLTLATFAVAAPAMALRPQLMGMALFAVLLLIISMRRSRPRAMWLSLLIVATWANVHGSFVIGALALGLTWVADVADRSPTARQTMLITALTVVAACVTPFGPAVWAYAAGLSSNASVTTLVSEWQPTSIRTAAGILFFASALAIVALLARRGRPTDWPALLWLGAFFAIGAFAERGIAWWSLAAAVAVTWLVEPILARDGVEPALMRRINIGVAAAMVLAGVALLPVWRPLDPGTRAPAGLLTDAPSGVTLALREAVSPGDRILNPQRWGSWFEYAFPQALVAVDSRVEIIPESVWRRHELALSGRDGWQDLLGSWGVTLVTAPASDVRLRDALVAAGWQLVYSGGDGHVLRHR